jgi:hypothetical protein
VRAQRLQLRRERQHPTAGQPPDVQRLLAEPIARHQERAIARVPHRQREHAAQARQRRGEAPRLDRRQDDLGVRPPAEPRATGGQLGAQLAVVVDLAVEDDRVAARRRGHRLVAERRQVDDREAAEAERDAAVGPGAGVIGAARAQRRRHRPRGGLGVGDVSSVEVEEAGDAAHRGRRVPYRGWVKRGRRVARASTSVIH